MLYLTLKTMKTPDKVDVASEEQTPPVPTVEATETGAEDNKYMDYNNILAISGEIVALTRTASVE